ncbi:IS66-like element accessory protein TnpA (plasmid) [Rhizobium ruizarguesonis]|jgi:transposase|uniref:Transposase n=2 Tax=Rhizobium TaxID=379 RepID=A0A179BX85_RHILE|nr:transposase [Rhizobium leguminosarum]OAP96277.1 transposase [Rhizobium leguminosarum]
MDEDAQKLQVRHVGRDGRRRYDPASIDRLVAACLEPGVSVSRLALEHGVNANLVRKWIKKAQQVRSGPVASAFIPVQLAADGNLPVQRAGWDRHSTSDNDPLKKPGQIGGQSYAAKVSALLPNGVNLTVECSDVDGLAAIIGALGHVQTGR